MTIVIGYKISTAGKTVTNLLTALKDDAVGISFGKKIRAFKVVEGKRVYVPIPKKGLFFRYGWRGLVPPGLTDMTSTTGMATVAEKFGFRVWAKNHDVPVPYSWEGEHAVFPMAFPVLWRPSRHTRGKEYKLFSEDSYIREYKDDGYFSEVIAKKEEYRVYVFNGHVWCVSQKLPGKSVGMYDPWNFALGNAKFKIQKPDLWNKSLVETISDCAVKLGIFHGAFDVVLDHDGFIVILEGNNAPALSGAQKPRQFARMLRHLEHHIINEKDIPKLVKGTSEKSPWLK